MRVLVAEDDAKLRDVLARGLRSAGYTVDVAARGDEALDLLLLNRYAAAVVDWRMPVLDGIDVVSALRARNLSTPVLMLTARDTPSDRIHGLDAGCDDYMVKPFDFQEMLARLRALMRRPSAALGVRLRAGALSIDPATRLASVGGTTLVLTPTEFAIVELLVRRSPAVVSRDAIANLVAVAEGAFAGFAARLDAVDESEGFRALVRDQAMTLEAEARDVFARLERRIEPDSERELAVALAEILREAAEALAGLDAMPVPQALLMLDLPVRLGAAALRVAELDHRLRVGNAEA